VNDAEFLKTKADGYEAAKWAYQWERDFALEQAARLRSIAERIEWRPIEELQKTDGMIALVLQCGRRFVAEWCEGSGHWHGMEALDGIEKEKFTQEWPGRLYGVTHYWPLPQPPEQP
jgi:hypothetical protein